MSVAARARIAAAQCARWACLSVDKGGPALDKSEGVVKDEDLLCSAEHRVFRQRLRTKTLPPQQAKTRWWFDPRFLPPVRSKFSIAGTKTPSCARHGRAGGARPYTNMPHDLPKTYEPGAIEARWAEYWTKEKLFSVQTPPPGETRPRFTLLLPPPNVTGRLHLGHMLTQTQMDIIVRWHRMRGFLTLWLPGTDHAGIATQMMVE